MSQIGQNFDKCIGSTEKIFCHDSPISHFFELVQLRLQCFLEIFKNNYIFVKASSTKLKFLEAVFLLYSETFIQGTLSLVPRVSPERRLGRDWLIIKQQIKHFQSFILPRSLLQSLFQLAR